MTMFAGPSDLAAVIAAASKVAAAPEVVFHSALLAELHW